jgi:hypothetical protein
MTSTATTRNRLNRQGTGDNVGTWGVVLNGQAIDLVDEAMDGVTSLTITGNVTLSSTNYATDQSRKRVLKLTGSPGATYTITVPSVEKVYVVHNQTNAGQIIKAGGTGATVPAGTMMTVYCDAVDTFAQSAAGAPVHVQRAYAEYTANADILGTIPRDNTIPQIGEGTQIISMVITPAAASNRLRVEFLGTAAAGGGTDVIAALFLNGGASAIRTTMRRLEVDTPAPVSLRHEFSPGSTAAQTLALRVGTRSDDSETLRFNGDFDGGLFGGTMAAIMTVDEFTA